MSDAWDPWSRRAAAPILRDFADTDKFDQIPLECPLYSCSDRTEKGDQDMLGWAVTFLIVALVAGVLGFGGIAAASAGIAQIIFYVFIVLFVVAMIARAVRGKPPV